MRGVVFLGDRQSEVRDFPDPQPGPGEVVVQLKAGGLCGSDLHLYRQTAAQRAGNAMMGILAGPLEMIYFKFYTRVVRVEKC